jgi:hypothetical protein
MTRPDSASPGDADPGDVGAQETSKRQLKYATVELMIAEYNSLRDEIVRASDREMQLATVSIIALGTLFATGIQFKNANLIFIYPLLAFALAAMWVAEDKRIQAVGAYIWKRMEGDMNGVTYMWWEHFVADSPRLFRSGFRNSTRLFYTCSAAAALILGVSISQHSYIVAAFLGGSYLPQGISLDDILLLIAGLSTLAMLFVLRPTSVGSENWRKKITSSVDQINAT